MLGMRDKHRIVSAIGASTDGRDPWRYLGWSAERYLPAWGTRDESGVERSIALLTNNMRKQSPSECGDEMTGVPAGGRMKGL